MATLALLPVNAIAGVVLLFSLETYDDSGRGAPFRSCTAESASCAEPSYGMAAAAGLCCLGTFFLAAWAGRHIGRLPRRFLFPLGAFSAGLTLAGAGVLGGLAVVFLLAG